MGVCGDCWIGDRVYTIKHLKTEAIIGVGTGKTVVFMSFIFAAGIYNAMIISFSQTGQREWRPHPPIGLY